MMPNWPLEENHCGTYAPGWLVGELPTTFNETVSASVCFAYGGNTCKHRIEEIFITQCEGFYLYALPYVPVCPMRYCSYVPCAKHQFDYPSCTGIVRLYCTGAVTGSKVLMYLMNIYFAMLIFLLRRVHVQYTGVQKYLL